MTSQLFEPGAPDVLYVVDVSGYVFRAYHAIQPLTSPSGEPTNAVFGTVNMLDRLIRECQPAMLAVAMDAGKKTFRKDLYAEYKANRPPPPPDLKQQMQRVEELLRALGVPIFVQPGVEADDLIASAVGRAREQGLRVVIVSADKDLMPLAGEDVLLWDTMRDRVFGPAEVEARFGVRVDQVRDLLALTGDSSDNVPGVPSVGPKTAQKLLQEYGSLDGVYASLDGISRKKLRAALEDNRDQAYLSRDLVTLRSDCPVELDRRALGRPDRDPAALRELYTTLGFQAKLAALDALDAEGRADDSGAGPEAAREPANAQATKQPELEIVTSPNDLQSLGDQVRSSGRLALALALQVTDRDEHLVGVGISASEDRCHYVPLSHRYVGAPKQLETKALSRWLTSLADSPSITWGAHDVKAARVALERCLGERLPRGAFGFDSLLAGYLLDAEGERTLARLAERDLGITLASEESLTRPKRGQRVPLDQLSVEELAGVCAQSALAVSRLWPRLQAKLTENHLEQLFETLELPLSTLLSELELRGVLVDVKLLAELGSRIEKQLAELERQAHEVAGRPFNVNAPRQLEALLFDDLGLEPLKRTKTARSTDAATLEALSPQHPLPAVVLEIRKLAKLKSTYIDALPQLVRRDTGRIHTRWGQTTAATGRLSSSDPNLQNIPIRTELGRAIRSAFVAPEGHELVSADYSQIELRVLAHLSEDPVLLEAFRERQDIHSRTAMEIFGLSESDVNAEHRRRAKAVNFGIIYGQGEHGLSTSLGISRSEAKTFIKAYFERYQGVRDFMERTLEAARREGAVKTLLGRVRRVPDISSKHHGRRSAAERVAMNTPIQGTAADLLKLAMLKLWDPVTAGCKMILTVHDELVFEVPRAEVEDAMPRIQSKMESVYELKVPLVVDVGHARAWDEAH